MYDEEAAAEDCAREFAELFRETYLRFHRRDGKRSELSGASRAVLLHLAQAGPMTIGDIALHLDRAQSVVSDIVTQLEGKDALARERDPDDRRRTLVWLTDDGFALLRADRDVLSTDLLTRSLSAVAPAERAALLAGLRALVSASPTNPNGEPS